jgi:hypothetical protein
MLLPMRLPTPAAVLQLKAAAGLLQLQMALEVRLLMLLVLLTVMHGAELMLLVLCSQQVLAACQGGLWQ